MPKRPPEGLRRPASKPRETHGGMVGDETLCRTCMRPIAWDTQVEPGFLPRTGWYDDARVDALTCFLAANYRHEPLSDLADSIGPTLRNP